MPPIVRKSSILNAHDVLTLACSLRIKNPSLRTTFREDFLNTTSGKNTNRTMFLNSFHDYLHKIR